MVNHPNTLPSSSEKKTTTTRITVSIKNHYHSVVKLAVNTSCCHVIKVVFQNAIDPAKMYHIHTLKEPLIVRCFFKKLSGRLATVLCVSSSRQHIAVE
jgi:hypothetical protein